MADDIDAMLQDEDQKPRSVSQTGNQNLGSDPENQLGAGGSPEEVEFNQLKGSTQERIKKILEDKRTLADELETARRTRQVPPAPMVPNGALTPEQQAALQTLKGFGVATQDDVNQAVQNTLSQIRYQYEIDRLEGKYSGKDGEPKFTKVEYEDYITRHPEFRNYFPEDVYQKMYAEELDDWRTTRSGGQKPRTTSLRPTRTSVQSDELTPEKIEERLGEPDGQQWYEKNLEKINKVLASWK